MATFVKASRRAKAHTRKSAYTMTKKAVDGRWVTGWARTSKGKYGKARYSPNATAASVLTAKVPSKLLAARTMHAMERIGKLLSKGSLRRQAQRSATYDRLYLMNQTAHRVLGLKRSNGNRRR